MRRTLHSVFDAASRDPVGTLGSLIFAVILLAFALRLMIFGGLFDPAAAAEAPTRALVLHADIRGTINPATADYLESSVKIAEARQAQALVVSLDTPGGLVSSVEKMAQAIDRSRIPVVVYVEPAGAAATSAGALLLLASHVSAMTPGSHMGAAHPVDSSGGDIKGTMGEKVVSDTTAFAQSIAELRGRDPKLAADIVRKSRSFTASEAHAAKLVDVLADSFPDLLRKIDGREVRVAANATATIRAGADASLESIEMTTGQKLLHLISNPNIAGVLMTLAMVLIYVELSHPGIQVAGVLGVVCLILAFMCFQTLPIRSGAIALLAVGAIALVAEIFVTSHGLLGAGGVLSFVLGLVWIIDPTQLREGVSPAVYVPAAAFLGGIAALVGWFAARTKAEARRALDAMKGGGFAGLAGYVGRVESLASAGPGSPAAVLGPFGKFLIRGELWDFVSEDSVRVGDAVQVVRIDGLRAIVKPVRDRLTQIAAEGREGV